VRTEKYPIGLVGGVVGGIDRDGRGAGPHGEIPQTRFETRWDGDKVLIERTSYSGSTKEAGPYEERYETWWLQGHDTLVIDVIHRVSGEDERRATLVYTRRAPPR
jgi:hypothetical protein